MNGQRAYPSSYLPPDEVVQFFTECLTRLKGKEIFIDDIKRLKREEILAEGRLKRLKRLTRKEKMATRQRTRHGWINPSLPTEVPPKVEDSPEWDGLRQFPMAALTLTDAMTLLTARRANAIYLDTRDRLMAAMRETR